MSSKLFEGMMSQAVTLAARFYDIDPLTVQVVFSKLSPNCGWQAYIQRMICDEKDNLISVDALYPCYSKNNEFGAPPFGDSDTVYNSLVDLVESLLRAIVRKESLLDEKNWNEMAEAPLMFGSRHPIDQHNSA